MLEDRACPSVTLSADAPNAGTNISQSLLPAIVGQQYTQTFTASGGSGTGSWQYDFKTGLDLGTASNKLSFAQSGTNGDTLTLSGKPLHAGTYLYNVYAKDGNGDVSQVQQYTLTVCPAPSPANALTLAANGMVNVNGDLYPNVNNPTTPVINALPAGTSNVYYSQTFAAFGGTGPYTFSSSLTSPAGLTFSPQGADYTLSGTPTATGSFIFQITAKDQAGASVSDTYQLTIDPAGPIRLARQVLQPGTVGTQYQQQLADNATSNGSFDTQYVPFELLAAGGSGTGYTFRATDALPPGMSLSSSGVLGGTPTKAGDYTLDVAVTDSLGAEADGSYALTILPSLSGSYSTAYTPAQILQAYGINQVQFGPGIPGNGAGVTVAVLESGDDAQMASSITAFTSSRSGQTTYADSDMAKFINHFAGAPNSLPQFASSLGTGAPVFLKLDQNGGTNYPASMSPGNTGEWAQDVETIHSLAPLANIVVFEVPAADTWQQALQTAFSFPGNNPLLQGLPPVSVVSVSYEDNEWSTEAQQDPWYLSSAGQPVTVVSSAGDEGSFGPNLNGVYYASASPNVVGAAMTQLTTDSAGNYIGELGVSGAGGGVSLYEQQPNSAISQVTGTSQRTTPDLGFVGSVNSGMTSYYDGGLGQANGSSNAAPGITALLAIVNQGRHQLGKQPLNGPQTLSALYALPAADFNPITQLDNGSSLPAGRYNQTTGLGSPVANLLIPGLVGPTLTANTAGLPADATTLVIHGSGFSTTPADDVVTFSNGATGTVTAATATQLTVTNLRGLTLGPLTAVVTVTTNGFTDPSGTGSPVPVATITLDPTTTTINAPGINFGATGVVLVRVSGTMGIPTGSVQLLVDAGTAGQQTLNGVLDGSGQFTFSVPGLAAGSHSLSVTYAAQGHFAASSGTGILTVNPAPASSSRPPGTNRQQHRDLNLLVSALFDVLWLSTFSGDGSLRALLAAANRQLDRLAALETDAVALTILWQESLALTGTGMGV